jgi:hypothetical protein
MTPVVYFYSAVIILAILIYSIISAFRINRDSDKPVKLGLHRWIIILGIIEIISGIILSFIYLFSAVTVSMISFIRKFFRVYDINNASDYIIPVILILPATLFSVLAFLVSRRKRYYLALILLAIHLIILLTGFSGLIGRFISS